MVFLILAAQYERWSLPLAELTRGADSRLFGAIVAIWLRGHRERHLLPIGLVNADRPRRQETRS